MYVTLEHQGRKYLFVMCPYCRGLHQISGKKKKNKVWFCIFCSQPFVEGA